MVAAISWSGGKDGWLALLRARAAGLDVRYALTMFDESGERSRSHAVRPELMAAQTAALELEPVTVRAPWQDYETNLVAALRALAGRGVDTVVFGDIDIAAHRAFEERVCTAAGLTAHLPLWQQGRGAVQTRSSNARWASISMSPNTTVSTPHPASAHKAATRFVS